MCCDPGERESGSPHEDTRPSVSASGTWSLGLAACAVVFLSCQTDRDAESTDAVGQVGMGDAAISDDSEFSPSLWLRLGPIDVGCDADADPPQQLWLSFFESHLPPGGLPAELMVGPDEPVHGEYCPEGAGSCSAVTGRVTFEAFEPDATVGGRFSLVLTGGDEIFGEFEAVGCPAACSL